MESLEEKSTLTDVSLICNKDLDFTNVPQALKIMKLESQLESFDDDFKVFPNCTIKDERDTTKYLNDHNYCIQGQFQSENKDKLVVKSIKEEIKLRIKSKLSDSQIIKTDLKFNSVDDEIKPETSNENELIKEYNIPEETTSEVLNQSAKLLVTCNIVEKRKTNKLKPKLHSVQDRMRIYSCSECSFLTVSRSTLRNHKTAKHTKILYNCPRCSFTTKWRDYIQDHIATHFGEEGKRLHCDLCDFKTALRTNLARHKVYAHVTERQFECELCTYKGKLKRDVKKHIEKTHNKGNCFKCKLCDYKTEFKKHLIEHTKSHIGGKFLKCPECDYRGRTKRSIKIHLLSHSTEKSFECYECGHKARSKHDLISHVQIHRNEKPYKCKDCEYSCRQKYSLNLHFKTYGHSAYSNDKEFRCEICEYITSSDQTLKWHKIVHTGERTFECHLCEYKTTSSSNFRKHEYIHENKKLLNEYSSIRKLIIKDSL